MLDGLNLTVLMLDLEPWSLPSLVTDMLHFSLDVSPSYPSHSIDADFGRVGRWHFLLLLYYGVFVPDSLRRMENLLENEYCQA